ncbi:hypothetical protein ASE06_09375 [Sphingopyxis sp. Root214]|nr:SIR2 family protein [Sphingopyxis sp. Root154]KQZ72689.1 hypothetical protein ASD73_07020 [Sphingopyxis sp. Root154]KRC06836.1 hypothetical protein ASE06_09375 [Sphingopyxis sp. Root214]
MDPADNGCRYKIALDQVITQLSPPERQLLHLDQPVEDWPANDRLTVTCRLAGFYSEVLETQLDGEADADFLLWQAVDVPGSFTGDDPDAEHLCIVMLTLEGAFRDISSANWDYLIEAAERELAGTVGSQIDVCIRAGDFQGAGGRAKLLKYHGCAVKAVAEPDIYRPLLIARTPQIQGYRLNAAYNVMRGHLVTLVQQRRTLMIGFSAQDNDVQEIFVEGAQHSNWDWNAAMKAFIFAEEDLKQGQKGVLTSAYGEPNYHANRVAIEADARVRAFAKPLLIALLLNVLELKVAALTELGLPAGWLADQKVAIASGLRQLRDGAAATAADPLAFVRRVISALNHGQDLFQHGNSDHGRYLPISRDSLQQIGGVSAATGLRQASVALALLGHGAEAGDWGISNDTAGNTPMRLDQEGKTTRVFLAANDYVASSMVQNGHVDPDSDDTVVLLSASARQRNARFPGGKYGRDGKVNLREICMSSVIEDATDAADLLESFKRSASL